MLLYVLARINTASKERGGIRRVSPEEEWSLARRKADCWQQAERSTEIRLSAISSVGPNEGEKI
jgi:hypothetical protein